MATTYTENYHLGKQENHADKFSMDVITSNMDLIDAQLKENADNIESKADSSDFAALVGLESEDRAALVELVDSGAKNLVQNIATSATVVGVDFTVNSDGTIIANGTASTAAWFSIANNITLPVGAYVISGGQVVDGTVNVRVVLSTAATAASIIADSNGDSALFICTSPITATVYVRMSTGRTADNVLVEPMICTKAAWDISHAYQPYRPPYQELYERVLALEDGGNRLLSINRQDIADNTQEVGGGETKVTTLEPEGE